MWAEVSPGRRRAVDVERGRPAGLRHRGASPPARPAPLRPIAAAGRRGTALGRHRRRLLPRPPVPGRPGRRRAAAVVDRRHRRHRAACSSSSCRASRPSPRASTSSTRAEGCCTGCSRPSRRAARRPPTGRATASCLTFVAAERRPPARPRCPDARGGRPRDAHHRDGDRSLQRARAPGLRGPRRARRGRTRSRVATARPDVIVARSRPASVAGHGDEGAPARRAAFVVVRAR